jgi:hypothetical protein
MITVEYRFDFSSPKAASAASSPPARLSSSARTPSKAGSPMNGTADYAQLHAQALRPRGSSGRR